MAKSLKATETINGALGTCYAIIDGNKEEMMYLKSISAEVKKSKSEIKVLGYTGVKHKATGWSGSGSATIYYTTTKFREMMFDYMKTGQDTYFELVITNEDAGTDLGAQTIVLKGVNIDNVTFAKLDVDSTELEEDISFTFNGADILSSFSSATGEDI